MDTTVPKNKLVITHQSGTQVMILQDDPLTNIQIDNDDMKIRFAFRGGAQIMISNISASAEGTITSRTQKPGVSTCLQDITCRIDGLPYEGEAKESLPPQYNVDPDLSQLLEPWQMLEPWEIPEQTSSSPAEHNLHRHDHTLKHKRSSDNIITLAAASRKTALVENAGELTAYNKGYAERIAKTERDRKLHEMYGRKEFAKFERPRTSRDRN